MYPIINLWQPYWTAWLHYANIGAEEGWHIDLDDSNQSMAFDAHEYADLYLNGELYQKMIKKSNQL